MVKNARNLYADMQTADPSLVALRSRSAFFLFLIFMIALWLAGGASRGDVSGQAIARAAAWGVVAAAALLVARFDFRDSRPVLVLLLGIIALPLIQLIPLPPSIWQALPGRALFAEATALTGEAQPWRPLSISPGATLNALSSLAVPAAVLILLSGLKRDERAWLPAIMIIIVIASMLVGLLQFSGAGFSNPLINYGRGSVSGNFANRNHFALLLALVCLIAPVWAFMRRDQLSWRGPLAIGMLLLSGLTILASGSRAGMAVGALSLILGPLLVREDLRRVFQGVPRWVLPAMIALFAAGGALIVTISIVSGRAVSIDRLVAVDIGEDMRGLGLPTVWAMVQSYFPVGIGFGSFDALFRVWEPLGILQIVYFNHAHNDVLELILEAGLPGLVLMIAAMAWWAIASARVWRRTSSNMQAHATGRLGSAMILLVLLGSVVDYPARTPLIMAVVVIAACWLAWGERAVRDAASLPKKVHSL